MRCAGCGPRIHSPRNIPVVETKPRVGAASRCRGEGRRAARDRRTDAALGVEDFRGHDSRLVDLRAGAVQGRAAGGADGLSGRRADARRQRPLAGSRRVRQPDCPRRHAADDCRLHQSRQRQDPSREQSNRPSNRGFEYDSLGNRYVRFLLEEIIPEVEKRYRISPDPEMRAIGGSSSGAICAFTVAWERPDQFRKVYSSVGSFTNLRGGNVYPALIRKTEPKPLRVYHGRYQRRRR